MSKISVDWGTFYLMNALGILWGIVCAELANTMPMVALSLPALLLINATFFHIGGFIRGRGRFSPGLITAVFLFYPIGIWCYKRASDEGILDRANLIGSMVLGAIIMAVPLLLLKARTLSYFKQSE